MVREHKTRSFAEWEEEDQVGAGPRVEVEKLRLVASLIAWDRADRWVKTNAEGDVNPGSQIGRRDSSSVSPVCTPEPKRPMLT